MTTTFIANNVEDLDDIGKSIINETLNYRNFAIYGEMGVGKTTLIKVLSLHLGVLDNVSSPTFSIVNEYVTKKDYKIYHFDFYRIGNEEEIYNIGFEEYFLNFDYCFIEWPERIPNIIVENIIKIYISQEDNKRIIEVNI